MPESFDLAAARAAASLGASDTPRLHITAARELPRAIEKPDNRAAIAADLESISFSH